MRRAKRRSAWIVIVVCAVTAVGSAAQTFTNLFNFDVTHGADPNFASLIQGPDADLYGTTEAGGSRNLGTIFKITPTGTLTIVYSFCLQHLCPDGATPLAGLVLATDGNLYGVTTAGGDANEGTIFKITLDGTFTTLHSFAGPPSDGMYANAPLVEAADGFLYGTTYYGGANMQGTVYRVSFGGLETVIHNFAGPPNDGAYPRASLIQATNGDLYGTSEQGGTDGEGTAFRITSGGEVSLIHSFLRVDGGEPEAALVQATDGNFYGTTQVGGNQQQGTIFRVSASGLFRSLYSFCAQPQCADGMEPVGGLIQAADELLRGTASGGGAYGDGTIFAIAPSGQFSVEYSFADSDGTYPTGNLVQSTNGSFYGTTYLGGANGKGTVFDLSTGLGPFVTFVRDLGYVGQTGPILGQGFTGTTNVSLNGTSVPFTVKSDTLITATIPAGGTTGPVTVTTPTGTLTSNVPFRVLPQLLNFTPTSGPVGTQVTITGVSLTQTSGVGFGDYTPAQFTVNSDTQVTATVPSGAKSGPVGIQTQGGIAISTQVFTVTQ